MKEKELFRISVGLLLLLMLSVALNFWLYLRPQEGEMKTEMVSHTEVKENTVKQPEIASEAVIGKLSLPVRYVFLPMNGKDSTRQAIIEPPDSSFTDALPTFNGDSLEIPITQRIYEDSLYTAYVSGYRPSLDSITVRERLTYTTVTNTRTITKNHPVTVGLVGGYGYGFRSKQLEPFIGLGLSVNLFPR